jgi:periplasmic protein CpxP/Spy
MLQSSVKFGRRRYGLRRRACVKRGVRQSLFSLVLVEDRIVTRWLSAVLLVVLIGAPQAVLAQESSAGRPPSVAPAAGPQVPNPAPVDASDPANYGSTPRNYGSPAPAAQPKTDPAARAAAQQSGINEAQAASLLQQKGYYRVEMQADPNSVWVWQADAMKDGRPVRIGIDYRGNVLELSSSEARPCTSPGVRLGVAGSLGAGSQLQQADACR